MDAKAKHYLDRQEKGRKELVEKLRRLILSTFPAIKETGMNEGLWYEGKFYIATFRDHVNLGVGITGLSEEEKARFLGRGKTMRHLTFYSLNDIDDTGLIALMKLVHEKANGVCTVKWKK